jgi:hypothetical protein
MALRQAIGAPLSAGGQAELERFLASLERNGNREAVQLALRAGQAMAPGEAVSLALG